MLEERISVAPMMEMTDSHWRMMLRGITRKTVLYTEMVVDDAVNHTDSRSLDYVHQVELQMVIHQYSYQ